MRVLQVLPRLDSGGVERGTVEFAAELVKRGHESLVMSAGGLMVPTLEQAGSTHIEFPVHRKSLTSLLHVRRLRQKILALKPDIVHVRSRVPAWMVWLALKKLPPSQRPGLVSTFHGLYSVNFYSAIMGCGDQVIAISDCVKDYVLKNYPRVDAGKLTVIHRGIDPQQFNPQAPVNSQWQQAFFDEHPPLAEKPIILMPGRLTRWKGQEDFIAIMARLIESGVDCQGVIVGGPSPGKEAFEQALKQQVADKNLASAITFLGHRSDIHHIYRLASVVCNLSRHAEPFGRTVIEALGLGVPVVSWDYGGPAESLRECLPGGLVPLNDYPAMEQVIANFLQNKPAFTLPRQFTLPAQADATLGVYETLLRQRNK